MSKDLKPTSGAAALALQALRAKAIALVRDGSNRSLESAQDLPVQEIERLVHELEVHQIELELQNEELRRLQAQLDGERSRYFSLYDLAPIGYVTLTEHGLIQETNLQASVQLGRSRSRLAGQSMDEFIAEEDQDQWRRFRRKVMVEPTSLDCELRLDGGDGTPVWTRFEAAHTEDDAGRQVLRLVMTDISAKRAREAAEREEAQTQMEILDAIPAHVALVDPEGIIRATNESWRRFATANFLQGPEFSIGQNYLEVCESATGPCSDEAKDAAAGIRRVLSGESGEFSIEYPCHSTTEQCWFRLMATPLHEGLQAGAVVMHVNITERKQAEQELQTFHQEQTHLLEEKTALLKEVHHRVKNNLQVVTSLLRLETGRSEHESTRRVLDEMQGRIRSMALLHETLYRSGNFATVDLGHYLGQVIQQAFRAQAGDHGAVQLVQDLAPAMVEMDQAIPCGLLVNELVSNCFKHGFPAGQHGEIRATLQAVDGGPWLCLCISDSGVGLPPDFEARRENSLGMQLVSDLTAQLQGTLEIGPGPGSTFTVMFTPSGGN